MEFSTTSPFPTGKFSETTSLAKPVIGLGITTGSGMVKAIGVGGDFFYFHALPLRGGAYIDGEDLMDDLVVLAKPLTAERIRRNRLGRLMDSPPSSPGCQRPQACMSRLLETASITGYEVVMPNPITGFAKEVVSENFPVGNPRRGRAWK